MPKRNIFTNTKFLTQNVVRNTNIPINIEIILIENEQINGMCFNEKNIKD